MLGIRAAATRVYRRRANKIGRRLVFSGWKGHMTTRDEGPTLTENSFGRVARVSALLALFAGAGCTAATAAPAPAPAQAATVTPKMEKPAEARVLSSAFAATAKALRPSVVRIDVESGPPRVARGERRRQNVPDDLPDIFRHFFDMDPGDGPGMPPGGGARHGTGSGIIIDQAGNIVTNRHVVEDASKVTVTLWDGTEVPAKVVGADPRTGVAVVRLEKVPRTRTPARRGASVTLVGAVGALAIGTPRGPSHPATAGTISGMGPAGRRD